MTTADKSSPSSDPIPLIFDYAGEYLRIQMVALDAAAAARRAQECANLVNGVTQQEGSDARIVGERKRIADETRKHAEDARQCAEIAERIARKYEGLTPPVDDTLQSRMRVREDVQMVIHQARRAKHFRDEASRTSGWRFVDA
jgi:hypothetical protein